MKPLLAFLIVLGSIVSYYVAALSFGIFQRYPWPQFIGVTAGSAWLIALVYQQRTAGRMIATMGGGALAMFFFWYALSYSNYEPLIDPLQQSQVVADLQSLTLPNHAGQQTPVLCKRNTLIVLYRGNW